MNKEKVTVSISLISFLRIFIAILLVWLAYYLRDLIILVFVAFIFATTIEPLVAKMEKKRIPKGLAILGIFILTLFFLATIIDLIVPALVSQVGIFLSNFPSIVSNLANRIFSQNPDAAANLTREAINYAQKLQSLQIGVVSGIFSTALNVFSFFASVIIIMVLTFYMLLGRDGVGKASFKYLPKEMRERVERIFHCVTSQLSNWLKGQLLLSVFIGVISYVFLLIAGVPLALSLSLFAALMELVPVLGPFISFVPAGLLALSVSPTLFLVTAIGYLVIQQFENHILVPQVMRKALGLSPVVIIVSMLAGAKLFGLMGVLLAAPVAASIQVIFADLYGNHKKKINKA